MTPWVECECGASVSWGVLATEEQKAAWAREHEGHGANLVVDHVRIRCASEDEARELARDLRPTHVVGRVGASLHVKDRRAA